MSEKRIIVTGDKNREISPKVAKGLSESRRAEIHKVESKKIENNLKEKEPVFPQIAHSQPYRELIKKRGMSGPVTLPSTHSLNELMGPDIYSPLYQLANMNLPRDRNTMHAWNRVFYDTHPIVRNAINLHASYPISKINISHPIEKVQNFFLEMADKLDLYSVIYGMATEFWKQGECFPYAELDYESKTWKRIIVMNPDYINVKKSPIGDHTIISLKPDAAMTRLVASTQPADIKLKRMMPKHVVDAIQKGHNIPLDNINISHLKLLSSPYDIRGTSIIVSCWKLLMQYDKLMESKYAQSDGMINPLTLATVGTQGDYRPTQADIDAVRQALEDAQYDKNFTIVAHDGIKIERIGYNGGVMDIASDLEFITKNLYVGLMVPESIISQEGSSYSSSSIGLEVLRQRYDIFRNMIKKWLEQKIFAPISELQGFVEFKDGQQIVQVPTVDFNHMNLFDMGDYISNISNFVKDGKLSYETLCRSLGLSYQDELRRLKQERIDNAIAEKEIESLKGMRLRQLESLSADSIIPEPADGAADGGNLMGESPGDSGLSLPGMMPPPGDMGGDLPPPDLGGPAGDPNSPPPAE